MDEKYNFGTVCNWNSTKKEGRSLQSAKRKLQRVLQAMLFEAAAAESWLSFSVTFLEGHKGNFRAIFT